MRYRAIVIGILVVVLSLSSSSTLLRSQTVDGGGGAGTITDIQDGAGNSVMDAVNSAMNIVCVSGCGGTGGSSAGDDGAFTVGTEDVNPVGLLYDDTAPDSVDEGDRGIQRMSANRNAYTTIRDAAGNERGLNIDANGDAGVTIEGQAADVTIADGGNNISVDWAGTAPPIGEGLEATGLRVTIGTDSDAVVSLAAIETAVESTDTSITNIDNNLVSAATHDSAAPADGMHAVLEAKDQDGSALPNAVSGEGDAVRAAGSLSGVMYVMPVNENGSDEATIEVVHANDIQPVTCNNVAIINTAAQDETELVALSGSTVIYVCGFVMTSEGTVDAQLVNGTGTTCQTGQNGESGNYALTADRPVAGYPNGAMRTDAGDALCINLSGAVQVNGEVYYAQF